MALTSNQRLFIAIGLLLVTIVLLLAAGLSPAALRGFAQGYRSFVTIFLGIFIEALPFLLLGTLASGLVEQFVSREALERFVPHSRMGGALAGALMGLAFPVCECGVVPLTRRLFRKGLPLPVGVSFLLAAPVINPVVIASTYAAFGWGPVLMGRLVFTLLIATAVGLIFGFSSHPRRLLQTTSWPLVPTGDGATLLKHAEAKPVEGLRKHPELVEGEHPDRVADQRDRRHVEGPHPPLSMRLTQAFALAGDEFFEMGRYLVLGSLLAAGMQTLVPQSALLAIGRGALSSVVAMLTLAFVLSVCSTVDAFLALAFVNTFTTGSILGFLVFGPMVDIKSILMFLSVFRRRIALYLVLLPLMLSLFLAVYLNLNVGW